MQRSFFKFRVLMTDADRRMGRVGFRLSANVEFWFSDICDSIEVREKFEHCELERESSCVLFNFLIVAVLYTG